MTPEALTANLAALPVFAGRRITELRRLSGGASLQTWAFTAGEEGYVLRRREGAVPDDDSQRTNPLAVEAALIGAAAVAGAPVAAVVHVSAPHEPLGEAHITRHVQGESLGRRIVDGPEFAAVRPQLARQCGAVLADLHRAAIDGIPVQTVDFLAELARYETVYRESGAQRPVLDLAVHWLRSVAPPPVESVLVHGDFRNGNLIVHPVDGVVAVLDWELAHRGDPAEDLGWLCVNSWRFGRPEHPAGGFGSYVELLDGYVAAGGPDVPLARVRAWQALGTFKWGAICLLMYASFADGSNRSVERPMIGRRVSETEIDLLALMESGL